LDFRLKDESSPKGLAVHWQKKGANLEEEPKTKTVELASHHVAEAIKCA
jgi:hypothetical protein